MLLMRGALSSGAVSSSWIWNLLTAVFTVTCVSLLGLRRRQIVLTEPLRGLYFTFSRLLTCCKLYRDHRTVSTRPVRITFLYPYYVVRHPCGSFAYRCGLPDSQGGMRHGRATP